MAKISDHNVDPWYEISYLGRKFHTLVFWRETDLKTKEIYRRILWPRFLGDLHLRKRNMPMNYGRRALWLQ
jgi:hypothetical protein